MLAKLAAYIQTQFLRRTRGIVAALEGERGQGTVEYVGLILLVSLLMIGMVAAMKGFNGHLSAALRRVRPTSASRRSGFRTSDFGRSLAPTGHRM